MVEKLVKKLGLSLVSGYLIVVVKRGIDFGLISFYWFFFYQK